MKTRTIAADFSTGSKAIDIVREELGDLPVGILGKCRKWKRQVVSFSAMNSYESNIDILVDILYYGNDNFKI